MSRGRPALDIGTAGVYSYAINEKGQHVASCGFRWQDGRRSRITRSAKSKAEATRALNRAVEEAKLEVQGHGSELSRTSTVSKLIYFWFEEHQKVKELSPTTIDRYEDYIERFVVKPFGELKLHEISVGMLDKYQKQLWEGGTSRPKSFRIVFKPALDLAHRFGVIDFNPLDRVAPLKSAPKKPVRAATDEEVELILRELPLYRRGPGVRGPAQTNVLEDGILAFLGTGLRIGELMGLRRGDLNFDASPPTISVNGTLIRRNGHLERKNAPKTPSSVRTIPVAQFVVDAISRRLSEDPCDDPEQTVFRSKEGTFLADCNFRRMFRDFLTSIGLDSSEITPHTFRATYATHMDRAIGIHATAKSLGHSSINTTLKSYIAQPNIVNPEVLKAMNSMYSANTRQVLARMNQSDDFFEI